MSEYESKIRCKSNCYDDLFDMIASSILSPGDLSVLRYGHMFGSDTSSIEEKLNRVTDLFLGWKEYWEDV